MKKLSIFIFLLLFACSSSSSIEWMGWQEAENRTTKKDKKGFVWVYTDWCEQSQKMMDTHLKNSDVIRYINENFYAIEFNGQSKEDITIKDKTWRFVETAQGDYHELAQVLTVVDKYNVNQSIAYPRIVFLDEELNLITPIDGNLDLKELEMVLAFVATDSFKEMTIEQFMLKFTPQFKE